MLQAAIHNKRIYAWLLSGSSFSDFLGWCSINFVVLNYGLCAL